MEVVFHKVEEHEVHLEIVKGAKTGTARVVTVDQWGERLPGGHLVVFTTDGRVRRCKDVRPDLGFQLDMEGRIEQSFSLDD